PAPPRDGHPRIFNALQRRAAASEPQPTTAGIPQRSHADCRWPRSSAAPASAACSASIANCRWPPDVIFEPDRPAGPNADRMEPEARSPQDSVRDEHTAAADAAMVQVVDRLIDVVQPVALRVQFDLALGVERHQLAELGVVAD